MKLFFLLPVLLMMTTYSLMGQDTLYTMEGDEIITSGYKYDEAYNEVSYKNQNMKIKTIDSEELFSIVNEDGSEKVFYKYDPANGYGIQVDDMREYVKGQVGAKKTYNKPMPFLLGFAAGFGGIFLIENKMYSPMVPLGVIAVVGFTRPNGAKLTKKAYGVEKSEYFSNGYAVKAKTKRMNNTVIGSLAGLALGAIFYSVSNAE